MLMLTVLHYREKFPDDFVASNLPGISTYSCWLSNIVSVNGQKSHLKPIKQQLMKAYAEKKQNQNQGCDGENFVIWVETFGRL